MSRPKLIDVMSIRLMVSICVLALTSMTSFADRATGHTIDRKHFEIVGLTLFEDKIDNIERKLGPAEVFHRQGSPTPERCYVSTGTDRTALILEDWTGLLIGAS